MGYELIDVREPADWRDFHAIRRRELFEARGRFGIYNDQHPDDVADFARPYLLKVDGQSVGTMRLDLMSKERAAFRLVAVTADQQKRGHGRVMTEMVEDRARHFGVTELVVNAAAEAVGFYEKTGWTPYVWDEAELLSLASPCIQMRKMA